MRGRSSLAFAFIIASVLAVPGCQYFRTCPAPAAKPALSEKEALTILEKLDMRDASVLAIRSVPVKGLWEVGVENRGRRFVLYVDSSKKFVSPGPFIDYASRKDVTKERIAELNRDKRVDVGKLSLKDGLAIGERSAPIKVVVFTDPGCPYCARLHQEMKKIAAKRNDIVFHLKLFALVSPDPAQVKSVICSNSLSTLEKAFEREQVPDRDCASTDLEDNMQFAEANGITAAPALIFPDGSLQLGFSEAPALEKTIDEAAARHSAGK